MEIKRYLRVVASTGDDGDDYSMVEISNRRAIEAADRIEKDAQHIDEMYALVAAMNADHTASKTRIEKLEAALQAVIRYAGNAGDDYLADKARKALEGKEDE